MTDLQKARVVNFILLSIAVTVCAFWFRSCDSEQKSKSVLITSNANAVFWKDKFHHSNAQVSVLSLDKKTFKKTFDNMVDSLKKQGIKAKNVSRVVTLSTMTAGKVPFLRNHYSDNWESFSLIDSILSFSIRDSLALITHYQKFGFLNLKSKYVTQAISYNPHSNLTGITSVEIVPKTRRINLGLYSGYGLSLSNGEVRTGWQVGIGIQFRVF